MGVITSVRLSKSRLEHYPQLYTLLGTMTVFQLAWLFATWVTGASTDWQRILGVAIYTVLIAAVVTFLPENTVGALVTIKDRLVQGERRWLVGITIALLIAGGIYAWNQSVWTDELHVFRGAGIVAEQGIGELFNQYAGIRYLGRQHPPLIPIVHGFVMRLLGVGLMSSRLVSLLFFIGAVIVVYFIGRELIGRETGLLGAAVLLSFPLVGRLGTAGQMDIHLLFFFTLSLLAILRLQQRPSLSLALLTGLVIGLGLLTKYLMVLIFPVLGVLFLIRPPLRRIPVHLTVTCLVAGAMLGAWLLYANSAGILSAQRTVIGIHASYVVSNDNGVRWMLNSLLTKLPSAIGLYNFPLIVISGWVALRRREGRDLFLLAWILVIALILTVTLPDHRYFMLTFPALAILIADWLKAKPALLGRVVLLQLLFAGGALFFLVDWVREAELFVR